MSKARPHAHIYEKWVRGIRKAVPNAEERCSIYEYIFAYQYAKIYETTEIPNKPDGLSETAAAALNMLEGDIDELCEARKARVEANRENGRNDTKPTPTDPNGSEQAPTIQSNTIQSNTKQGNGNSKSRGNENANANVNVPQMAAGLLGEKISEFELGMALLRKGYLVSATELHSRYDRATAPSVKNPVAYAAQGMREADPSVKAQLAAAANFVEATGCKDTRALEMYGARVEDGVLIVRCTRAACDAIGTAGQDKAKRDYLPKIGATNIDFYCNG